MWGHQISTATVFRRKVLRQFCAACCARVTFTAAAIQFPQVDAIVWLIKVIADKLCGHL
jgi:hypothetical protein